MKSCVLLSSNLPRVMDKFDRSMTLVLGKLLDNSAQLLFLFLICCVYAIKYIMHVAILAVRVTERACLDACKKESLALLVRSQQNRHKIISV